MLQRQLKVQAQPRHARIERIEEVEINSEESHLWAVSYSDLLMVLMSFFIIFFSVDSEKREDLLKEIALSINSDNPNAAPGDLGSNSQSQKTKSDTLENFAKIISGGLPSNGSIAISEMKDGSVHVQFAPDAFSKRRYKLTNDLKSDISRLMESVRPFSDRIKITFIGHADTSPIAIRDDGIITDNFVLSALRASEGMKFAASLGMPKDSLFVQGSADNTLNSRTISVRIERK